MIPIMLLAKPIVIWCRRRQGQNEAPRMEEQELVEDDNFSDKI